MANLKLRPIHYACVSGGKDSLYMLKLIMDNPDKYPLDMVVHYELEIDHDFVKNVVNDMEKMCKTLNIPFVRIKPRKSWCELYKKYNMPARVVRWCNSKYKMDCDSQLREWIKKQNCRPVAYIGFCADEEKRFKYEIGQWENQDVCYPLAEEGLREREILEWARNVPQFNGWYKIFDRQGCWLCPNASRLELAYLLKHYPLKYKFFMDAARLYENDFGRPYWGDYSSDKMDDIIRKKWLPILEEKENPRQQSIFDYYK